MSNDPIIPPVWEAPLELLARQIRVTEKKLAYVVTLLPKGAIPKDFDAHMKAIEEET